MKRYPSRRLLTALLALAFLPLAFAAQAPKAPAPKAKKQPSGLKFRVQQLHVDNNEGCAIADFDRDGNLDISAGEFWYAGPTFAQKRPVRKLEPFQKDYLTNNGEHAVDVDGDGWVDIVSGAFMDTTVAWYRNPGAEGLKGSVLWERKALYDTKLAQNEISLLHDLDGDGKPEFVVNSWGLTNAMMAYSFIKDAQGQPTLKPWTIQAGGPAVNGHGIGFGDLSGDGKDDILFGLGWYERPAAGADTQPWRRRPDWRFPHASTPMLVVDLNGDGRNDIIWGHGHNYGLYWEERRDDNKDGSTNWRHHTIDDKFSQAHALVWTDLDGDGQAELITGRRHKAHSGNDPGDAEPGCLYYFKWNKQTQQFTKFVIAEGGPGTGLQLRVVDMNKDGRPDIVAAGKASTHVVWNEGPK